MVSTQNGVVSEMFFVPQNLYQAKTSVSYISNSKNAHLFVVF